MTLNLNTVGSEETEEELLRRRSVLETSFPDTKVLKLGTDNRLRQLWERSDFIAASELLALAYAIETLMTIDEEWTKDHIKKILIGHSNEQIGSFFELVAASMLSTGGLKVIPGRRNSPGYDLEISYDGGHSNFVSLKNHDVSNAEQVFVSQCKDFRKHLIQHFESAGSPPLIMIDAKHYLVKDDWTKIEDALAYLKLNDQFQVAEIAPGIALGGILLKPLSKQIFAPKPLSNQLLVTCAYHANEQNNFCSKLEDAAYNMRKHLPKKHGTNNIVFMRLHPTASIPYLEPTAANLVELDDGVDGIVLYQTSITRTANQFTISHYHKIFGSDRWDQKKHPLRLKPYAGQWLNSPPRVELQGNGKPLMSNLTGYMFQEADYYHKIVLEPGEFAMSNPASGVHVHLVIDGSVLSAQTFPGEDSLLLM